MSPGSPAFKHALLSLAVIAEHDLLSPIASGAYGQVWLARNRLGVYRAVKIVHRANFDHARPFEREFAGIKAFEPISRSHEGLVDLLQVGRDDDAGYFYYVMELADDLNHTDLPQHTSTSSPGSYMPRTLASELKRRGRLPLEECIQIGLSLIEALAHLHNQGLVHRDIKPSNVIFVKGVAKLADVGLVAVATDARSFVGTEGFIPPEGPGTPQADLYSLGIVLYVLSTGKSHQAFPEPPADLSARENHAQWLEFDAVVHKACQANVRERYQHAEEMHQDLVLLQRGQSVKARRTAQRRWATTKKIGLGALGAALLVMALLLFKPARSHHTPNAEAARLYKLGQWYYSQLTAEAHAKALQYLAQAAQADPKFVEPYGEWLMLYTWNKVPDSSTDQRRLEHTKEIAKKALAIDPDAPEGHIALSWCKFLERDWRAAEDEIQRAIRLNPRQPLAHGCYCFFLSMQCRVEEARREGGLAEQFELPGSERVSAIIAAWPYMAERRYDLAIEQLRRVLDLDRNFAEGHNFVAQCYEARSNYLAAIEEYRASDLLAGYDPAKVAASYDALRKTVEMTGQRGFYEKWIELVHEDESLPEDKKEFYEGDLAPSYAALGNKARALDEFEKHFDQPQVWHQVTWDYHYDGLHDEPRYKELVRRAGLQP